jgi:Zn-dependent membrane protease YugP
LVDARGDGTPFLWGLGLPEKRLCPYFAHSCRLWLNRSPGCRADPAVGRISDVEIEQGTSFLGDHYDPMNKKLVLSPDNYVGSSAANVGVAAHECGHALQHQQHYAPLHMRMASVYATNFASNAVFYVVIASLWFHLITPHAGLWLVSICFGILIFFNLITLPVEFDASARAKVVLQRLGIVRAGPEADAVSSTLNAAGLTYVAALVGTILNAAYYIWLFSSRRN